MKYLAITITFLLFLSSCALNNKASDTNNRVTASDSILIGLHTDLSEANSNFFLNSMLIHLPTEDEYTFNTDRINEETFYATLTSVINENGTHFLIKKKESYLKEKVGWFSKEKLGYLIENKHTESVLSEIKKMAKNGKEFSVKITGKPFDKIRIAAQDKTLHIYYMSPTELLFQ